MEEYKMSSDDSRKKTKAAPPPLSALFSLLSQKNTQHYNFEGRVHIGVTLNNALTFYLDTDRVTLSRAG